MPARQFPMHLLPVENLRLLCRMNRKRIPKHNLPIPYIVDHALDHPLAEEPLCLANHCNFERIQPEESSVP